MFKSQTQGGVQVLTGAGVLTSEHISEARDACEALFRLGQPRIVVDLIDIALVDSAGLELLLDLRDRAQRYGGAVHLSGPNPLCRDILQATGLASEFAIFDDLNSSVGSFAR